MTGDKAFIPDVEAAFPDCLRDESRRRGRADSISFPADEAEMRAHLAAAAAARTPVTLQCARTGITAGAVPDGGHILNLSRMTAALGMRRAPQGDGFLLTVQPGLTLAELRRRVGQRDFDDARWSGASRAALAAFCEAKPHFFPPDPTETSASLGGMAACNASGARSFRYGPTRRYVQALGIVLADGDILRLERGRERAAGRDFSLRTATGRVMHGRLPSYTLPAVKNAAGYYAGDGIDMVDLFVGSEGTLGAFSEIEIKLVPAPATVWGVMVFLPREDDALDFVEKCRAAARPPAAMEYFSAGALALLREESGSNPAFQHLPGTPANAGAAIYVEYHGEAESEVEEAVADMSALMNVCHAREDDTLMASDSRELERLKDLRHAVPEIVNLTIDRRRRNEPGLTKLGTDLAVPDSALRSILALYHRGLKELDLEYVMFGHIGDNHIHVNILPENMAQYARATDLYAQWARAAVATGGTVSAEHGIGKLKTALLLEMYGREGVEEMRTLKRVFDPLNLLNRGNLF